MKNLFAAVIILILLISISTRNAANTDASEAVILGEWNGGIVFNAGDSYPASFYFFERDDQLRVMYDVPDFNAYDLSISEIMRDGNQIQLHRQNSAGDLIGFKGLIQDGIFLGDFLVKGERSGVFQFIQNNDRFVKHSEIPDFKINLLDDQTLVSKSSFANKYYMLDFWTTGCGPCIAEMPNLHQVYEKFKDKNFDILSLSLDGNPNVVRNFRENRWAMPWLNAHIGPSHKMIRDFQLKRTPTILLVSPEGIIVAKDDDLRAENLGKTLSRYLAKEKSD